MRLGWHCLAVHTGRYNGIVRDDRVCRLCQKLGYRDDTTGSVPVEDLVHFMLDCRVLHPVRDDFPLFFKPASLPGQSKDSHVKFILNHSDHVQVVRCISALKKRRESCLHITNKQKFKVRQPQRAAKSKRPSAPSDGSKNNGIHTTKQEEDPSRHPTTDTANRSTSKQSTSRRLMGVSKSNTIQSTNQAGCPVRPPHMYHPRRPAYQPRLIPKHVAI